MYEQLELLLTADEDSTLTDDEVQRLIEFCREELNATGTFVAHKFEEQALDEETAEPLCWEDDS